jgi:hypothetical protein
MNKSYESLSNYLSALAGAIADLPDGSEGSNESSVPTPPHSAGQRTTSVEKINGCKITKAVNEEGRVTLIITTDNGQTINCDETGNIFIGCGKIGDDETGGQITLRPQGDMTVKVGGRFAMEVENLLDEDKPLSVVSYGDINVESSGGDVFLKGQNVSIRALKDLNLIGEKVNIQGGDGAGGTVAIAANKFASDVTFIENTVSGGITNNVLGEITDRQILDPRSLRAITSSGHMKITAAGDLSIDVGGKMEVNIAGTPPKPVPTVKNPSTFSINVAQGNVIHTIAAGNLTEKYTGNVTTTIEGNVTEQITGNLTESATGNYTNTIEGNSTESITGDYKNVITGNYTNTVTGTSTETFTGAYTATYSGSRVENGAGIVTISGTTITINSTTNIFLN